MSKISITVDRTPETLTYYHFHELPEATPFHQGNSDTFYVKVDRNTALQLKCMGKDAFSIATFSPTAACYPMREGVTIRIEP
jgi:hypothetical protein